MLFREILNHPRSAEAERYLRLLATLAEQGVQNAADLLCRLAVEFEHAMADIVCRENKLRPADPVRRAVFLFLTRRWEEYDALDFNRAFLRSAYEAADAATRERILQTARTLGRLDVVQAVSGRRDVRKAKSLSAAEWDATIELLTSHRRWADLWRLVPRTSVVTALRLIDVLKGSGWQPDEARERDGFREICALAEKCPQEKPPKLSTELWHRKVVMEPDEYAMLRFRETIHLTADSKHTVIGYPNGLVKFVDLRSGDTAHTLDDHRTLVDQIYISHDGRRMIAANRDAIRQYRMEDAKPIGTLEDHALAGVSSDGRYAIVNALEDLGGVGLVSVTNYLWRCNRTDRFTLAPMTCASDDRIVCSATGNLYAVLNETDAVRIRSLPDEHMVAELAESIDSQTHTLGFSPDNRRVATGLDSGDVRLWNLETGTIVREFPTGCADRSIVYTTTAPPVAFTPDGRFILKGAVYCQTRGNEHTQLASPLELWRIADGEIVSRFEPDSPQHSKDASDTARTRIVHAFSPDGGLFYTFDNSRVGRYRLPIQVWGMPDCREVGFISHDDEISEMAVSPDGLTLVAEGYDGHNMVFTTWDIGWYALPRMPLASVTKQHLDWTESTLNNTTCPVDYRPWLLLLTVLYNYPRRYDIDVEHAPAERIEAGTFDIEIEWTT